MPGGAPGLAEAGQRPEEFLARHQADDWGEVRPEDKALNDRALLEGSRLLSAYRTQQAQEGLGDKWP